MPRLLELVTTPPRAITYRIEFALDASGRPKMIGRVEGMLPLVCQRCLDSLDWSFDATFESVVVGDEREETKGQDAVVCSDGRIALEPMIEDEVLLALPNAPVHAYGSCEAPPMQVASGPRPSPLSRPFASLRALRAHVTCGRSH